jgi:hypothetical protein
MKIIWSKPNFEEEAGEYFQNPDTINAWKKQRLLFDTKDELYAFLDHGRFVVHKKTYLNKFNTQNLTLDEDDFQEELKDRKYKKSYDAMLTESKRHRVITLPSPILIKFGTFFYGFSGNRRVNLAFSNDQPVKFWQVSYTSYVRNASLYYTHNDKHDVQKRAEVMKEGIKTGFFMQGVKK